ncbi:MAG: hypothetical protein A2Y80_05535 [Deltaproteobacteria bacterium RBG_13_58_19]|nr:MAG: hypothetical protein A2Y80_05535 [Deltaproteobacteria bacterium RBG_13_58_19]
MLVRHSFCLLALACLLLAGCASKAAREVARLTLLQVNTYEGLLDQKINAEKTYALETAALSGRPQARLFATKRAIVRAAALDFQGEVAIQQRKIQAKDIKNAFIKTFEDIREVRDRYEKASLEYHEMLVASLEALELQRGPLNRVRSGLEQLQNDANTRQFLKDWLTLGLTTMEKVNQMKSQ